MRFAAIILFAAFICGCSTSEQMRFVTCSHTYPSHVEIAYDGYINFDGRGKCEYAWTVGEGSDMHVNQLQGKYKVDGDTLVIHFYKRRTQPGTIDSPFDQIKWSRIEKYSKTYAFHSNNQDTLLMVKHSKVNVNYGRNKVCYRKVTGERK